MPSCWITRSLNRPLIQPFIHPSAFCLLPSAFALCYQNHDLPLANDAHLLETIENPHHRGDTGCNHCELRFSTLTDVSVSAQF